ncbi:MAG: hypothetical protein K2X66_04480, partial [Cyanobacteria bacterium]|nr:hypothetical protein [Cyanobacteriota bacterium]
GENPTHVTFPWVGTDTNSYYWARYFVSPYTLNGRGNKGRAHRLEPIDASILLQAPKPSS